MERCDYPPLFYKLKFLGEIMNHEKKGTLLVFGAVLLWSLAGFIIKSVEASALWIILIRSLSGGLFLSFFIFKEKISPMKNVILAALFMSLFSLSITVTTQISSSAMAISMQYAAPMYLIGYGLIKNKKFIAKKFIVLICIFIGVSANVFGEFVRGNYPAIVSGLAIGITFILYSTNLQKIKTGSPLGIVSLINVFCTLFYLLILPFNFGNPPTSFGHIALLIIAGILISGLSYAFYGWGLRIISVEKAMIIALAEPILNPIWVFLLNGEIPGFNVIVGMIFILMGAVFDVFFSSSNESTLNN